MSCCDGEYCCAEMKNRSYNYLRSHQTDVLAGPIICNREKRWVAWNSKMQGIQIVFPAGNRTAVVHNSTSRE